MNDLHGIIFAYRESPELRELTRIRNACSVPYGGRYRLIDFALSNLVNAGVSDVGIIVYNSYQSLLDHVGSGKDWDLSRKRGGLRILPPFSFSGKHHGNRYQGRMDALAGVYSYHADITAVTASKTTADPRLTTFFTTDAEGRVTDVEVGPAAPTGQAGLETYILSKSLLLTLVDQCASHDVPSFSQGVLQNNTRLDVRTFLFDGYAAQIQTVVGYYARSMELLDPAVRSSLFRTDRPIRTKDQANPSVYYGPEARSMNSLVSDGSIVEGTVINSILSRGVRVEKGAVVKNCILMQRTAVQPGATLRHVIADKNVRINPGRMLMGHETYPLVIPKNEIV